MNHSSIVSDILCIFTIVIDKDYCILPNQDNSLVHKDVDCSSNQPCQKCDGDCDHDGECTGFLICYQRDGYINIPGCAGSGVQRKLFRNFIFVLI